MASVVCSPWLLAQTPVAIVDIGFVPPRPPSVAPGQVISFFVRGLTAADAQPALPLPVEVGGLSALIHVPSRQYEKFMPLVRIQTLPCGYVAPGQTYSCDTRSVTVQVPTDLPTPEGSANTVTFYQDGVAGYPIEVFVRPQLPTLLNSCIPFLQQFPEPLFLVNCPTIPETSLITHADGRLVTAADPAHAGETVVLYFVGLGATIPHVPEGQPAPSEPAALVQQYTVEVAGAEARLEFAGLVPGYAGLYQVNVRLPDTLPPEPMPPIEGGHRLSMKLIAPGTTYGSIRLAVDW